MRMQIKSAQPVDTFEYVSLCYFSDCSCTDGVIVLLLKTIVIREQPQRNKIFIEKSSPSLSKILATPD